MRPEDLSNKLGQVSITPVRSVVVTNRSHSRARTQLNLGLDGSFFGYTEAVEGPNELKIVATLSNGQRIEKELSVFYGQTEEPISEEEAAELARIQTLQKKLAEIKAENARLLEVIRQRLVDEMNRVRAQRGEITIEAEEQK